MREVLIIVVQFRVLKPAAKMFAEGPSFIERAEMKSLAWMFAVAVALFRAKHRRLATSDDAGQIHRLYRRHGPANDSVPLGSLTYAGTTLYGTAEGGDAQSRRRLQRRNGRFRLSESLSFNNSAGERFGAGRQLDACWHNPLWHGRGRRQRLWRHLQRRHRRHELSECCLVYRHQRHGERLLGPG